MTDIRDLLDWNPIQLRKRVMEVEAEVERLTAEALPPCFCTSQAVPGTNHNPQCPRYAACRGCVETLEEKP